VPGMSKMSLTRSKMCRNLLNPATKKFQGQPKNEVHCACNTILIPPTGSASYSVLLTLLNCFSQHSKVEE